MSPTPHVLILTPGFPKDLDDTVCIPALQALVSRLALTHRVSVFALDYPFQRGTYAWGKVQVYAAACGNRKLAKLGLESQLRAWMAEIGPVDVVHSFWWGPAAWLGNRLHRRLRIPHVSTLMGQDVLPRNAYLKLLNPKRAVQVALSPLQAQLYRQHSGLEVGHVIPWGLDEALRKQAVAGEQERPIDILGVGNLIPVKNYARFVEVVAALSAQRPGLRAVLVGKGPEEVRLRQMIQERNLEEVLEMKGLLPRAQVLDLMERSKVLLHTGLYESYGYVFPEALSCGAVVVSLPVGIAQSHPRWKVVDKEEHLTEAVAEWLEHLPAPVPVWLHGMDDTAAAYVQLYASLMGGK